MKKFMKLTLVALAMSVLVASLPFTKTVEASSTTTFKDIKGHWAEAAIMASFEQGLVTGFPDGSFRPNDIVTADQFISMMYRAFNDGDGYFDSNFSEEANAYNPGGWSDLRQARSAIGFKFTNEQKGYWAKPYVDMVFESYLLDTTDDFFPKKDKSFTKQIKREEASYLLSKWISKYEVTYQDAYMDYVVKNSGLTDMNNFSSKMEMRQKAYVLMTGVIRGYPTNKFLPQRYVTRAEALTMIQRLKNKDLRDPFMPKPVGKYHIELNGSYVIFADKYRYDTYNSVFDIMNKELTGGYIDRTNTSLYIFDSKDEYERNYYFGYMGQYDKAPNAELKLTTDSSINTGITLQYETTKELKHSKKAFNSILNVLTDGKGDELIKKLNSLEKSGKATEFTFNGKQYKFYESGGNYVLVQY